MYKKGKLFLFLISSLKFNEILLRENKELLIFLINFDRTVNQLAVTDIIGRIT